jgi:universal stress protein A
MLAIRTILFATDFSPSSEAALPLACALARDYGARLVLVHVSGPPTVLDYRAMAMSGELVNPGEAAKEQFAQLGPALRGIAAECRIEEGDAAKEILRVADDIGADVIVMGTHGRTGLARLLGSVAEKVIRLAKCPVLTLRHPAAVASTPAPEPAVSS